MVGLNLRSKSYFFPKNLKKHKILLDLCKKIFKIITFNESAHYIKSHKNSVMCLGNVNFAS